MKKISTLFAALLFAVMSFAQAAPITVDLSQMTLDPSSPHTTGNWNGEQLDYFQTGDIANIPFSNPTESAYTLSFSYATILTEFEITLEIYDANGDTKYLEELPLPHTTPTGTENDWSYWVDITAATSTPVLPAGDYTLAIRYGEGLWDGAPNNFGANIKNMVLTPVATGEGEGGGEGTAEGVVILSNTTLNKDASTNDSWSFNGTEVYLVPSGGRDVAKCGVVRDNTELGISWGDGLNYKNNTTSTLVLPQGMEVYRIEFNGYSAGDNWCYLYAYGPADGEWEWTDPIGTGVKDNTTIYEQAKYPLDPCLKTDLNGGYSFSAPGYLFAAIDFGNEPYGGAFAFQFSGNNQEQASIKLYTTRAAADAAATGIESAVVEKSEPSDARMYNIAGQMVTESYKGIVIKNGKKYLNK